MPIDSKTFRPIAFGSVVHCTACNLGFVSPRPRPDETAAFYELDQYYTQGKSHLAKGDRPSLQSRLRVHLAWRMDRGEAAHRVIERHLPSRPARVCDVGCGTGRTAATLVAKRYEVVGVERDPKAVSFAGSGFTVLAGSVEALPAELESQSFDAVLLSHVLEHIVDPVAALREIRRILKPDGKLFLVVPNNESLPACAAGVAWEHLDIPRHLTFFDAKSLNKTVEQAGFKPVDSFFEGFCRYFSNSYIETEQIIFDQVRKVSGASRLFGRRNSQAGAWSLLLKAMVANDNQRYDSIGLVSTVAK